jgi:hypothetical protein
MELQPARPWLAPARFCMNAHTNSPRLGRGRTGGRLVEKRSDVLCGWCLATVAPRATTPATAEIEIADRPEPRRRAQIPRRAIMPPTARRASSSRGAGTGPLRGKGDHPPLLARRYRSHGQGDEFSQVEIAPTTRSAIPHGDRVRRGLVKTSIVGPRERVSRLPPLTHAGSALASGAPERLLSGCHESGTCVAPVSMARAYLVPRLPLAAELDGADDCMGWWVSLPEGMQPRWPGGSDRRLGGR